MYQIKKPEEKTLPAANYKRNELVTELDGISDNHIAGSCPAGETDIVVTGVEVEVTERLPGTAVGLLVLGDGG